MHQVRFGGMHGKQLTADNQQNHSNEDDVTDNEKLKTDPRLPASMVASAVGTDRDLAAQYNIIAF